MFARMTGASGNRINLRTYGPETPPVKEGFILVRNTEKAERRNARPAWEVVEVIPSHQTLLQPGKFLLFKAGNGQHVSPECWECWSDLTTGSYLEEPMPEGVGGVAIGGMAE